MQLRTEPGGNDRTSSAKAPNVMCKSLLCPYESGITTGIVLEAARFGVSILVEWLPDMFNNLEDWQIVVKNHPDVIDVAGTGDIIVLVDEGGSGTQPQPLERP